MGSEFEGSEFKLSWVGCFGAVCGLAVGVIITMLMSAWLHDLMFETRTAEIVWEIGAPLLSLLGVVYGFFGFQRFLPGRIWIAGLLCLLLLILGYVMVFYWVGFPWRGEGYGV